MYSTCTITHAIITKQYARQFYGQYNRYYHQKEKKGKIWHLNGSFERQGPQRWFSHCNCLLPPSSTGMSHYPVFLHLIPPVLTIYHCPSVCAGSQACQILRVESIQPLTIKNHSFLSFSSRVLKMLTQESTKGKSTEECRVRSSKVKQPSSQLPPLFSALQPQLSHIILA